MAEFRKRNNKWQARAPAARERRVQSDELEALLKASEATRNELLSCLP
jgi:hypothetical protein